MASTFQTDLLNVWGGGQLMAFSGLDGPTDFDLGLANQEKDRNMIVITERWASIDDFKAHIAGPPHVAEFRVVIKELLEKTSLKITQDAI